MKTNYIDRLLSVKGVAQILSIGKSTVWEAVKNNRLPKPIKLGPKITRWRESDIKALIN